MTRQRGQVSRLSTEGGPIEILATRLLTTGESVYNLEIHGHHVYQVTELGLLVHNSNLSDYREPKKSKLSGKNPPINQRRQKRHTDNTLGKSQFKPDIDADEMTRDAWHTGKPQFDQNGKFIGKIKEYGHQVGTQPNQNSVKMRFKRKHGIHGIPSSVGE